MEDTVYIDRRHPEQEMIIHAFYRLSAQVIDECRGQVFKVLNQEIFPGHFFMFTKDLDET